MNQPQDPKIKKLEAEIAQLREDLNNNMHVVVMNHSDLKALITVLEAGGLILPGIVRAIGGKYAKDAYDYGEEILKKQDEFFSSDPDLDV